ncbi:MAG TPA: signal peptidase I [Bacilli bacterium]|nr:signal peptidase I [Bacilli bacterium]HQD92434.1 signal peptidase I [Bacilli bacterium]
MKNFWKINFKDIILKTISKGTTLSIIFTVLLYMAINFFFPKLVIKIFGYQHFVITSTSMHPVLQYGDIVIVKRTNVSKIQEGMIISFYQDIHFDGSQKEVITHYVHSKTIDANNKYHFKTKRYGEKVNPDSWKVLEEEVIGIYCARIPKLGKTILFFRHPLGLRIILIDIIIIYLIVLILNPPKEEPQKQSNTKKLSFQSSSK